MNSKKPCNLDFFEDSGCFHKSSRIWKQSQVSCIWKKFVDLKKIPKIKRISWIWENFAGFKKVLEVAKKMWIRKKSHNEWEKLQKSLIWEKDQELEIIHKFGEGSKNLKHFVRFEKDEIWK